MMKETLNRRQFLKTAGVAALGAASASLSQAATPAFAQGTRQRSVRIAHMTDFHAWPDENGYVQGEMTRALQHAQGLDDPPAFMLQTGDAIFDSLGLPKDLTEWQWQFFASVLANEWHLPVYHAIGNHDVWGWGLTGHQIDRDPLYGKNMALKWLGIPAPYYSFDGYGWHFIVLDSTHLPNKVSDYPYVGQLDEEQFAWMVADIEATPTTTPICIASHIPILAGCEFFDGENEASGNWVVPGAWMHIDARRFRQFFLAHPNVRVCLSGHTHQFEAEQYLKVHYQTDGAICGAWWEGDYLDFPAAYVLVDLFDDGTAESQFVTY